MLEREPPGNQHPRQGQNIVSALEVPPPSPRSGHKRLASGKESHYLDSYSGHFLALLRRCWFEFGLFSCFTPVGSCYVYSFVIFLFLTQNHVNGIHLCCVSCSFLNNFEVSFVSLRQNYNYPALIF